MKIRILRSHVCSTGAVTPGTVLDVSDEIACEYLNAKLAEPVKDSKQETATAKKTKETATK